MASAATLNKTRYVFQLIQKHINSTPVRCQIRSHSSKSMRFAVLGGVILVSTGKLSVCQQLQLDESTFLRQQETQIVHSANHSNILEIITSISKNIRRAFRSLVRLFAYIFTLSPAFLTVPVALLTAKRDKETGEINNLEWWWNILTNSVEKSGPALLKFFQWAATRRDLFPLSFCQVAGRVQDRSEHAHGGNQQAWFNTKDVLDKEFGERAKGDKGWQWSIYDESRDSYHNFELVIDNDDSNIDEKSKLFPQMVGAGCVASVFKGRIFQRSDSKELPSSKKVIQAGNGFNQWLTKDQQNQLFELSPPPATTVPSSAAMGGGGGGGGLEVAVKVITPEVCSNIETDLALMSSAAWMLEAIPLLGLKWLGLSEAVAQFHGNMTAQLSMLKEAESLRRFQRNFKGNSDRLVFPKPVYATASVLCETFESGQSISKLVDSSSLLASKAPHDDDASLVDLKKRVARTGLEALLTMIFEHNFIHGDLHPGNILIRPRHAKSSINSASHSTDNYELVFIDAGIVCELEPRDAESLIDLCLCIVRGDGAATGQLMMERARLNSCRDPEAFQQGMTQLLNKLMVKEDTDNTAPQSNYQKYRDSLLSTRPMVRLSSVQIGEILSQVLNLCRVHGVLLETNFVSVICAITVLEGLGRALDPQIDVIAEATPFILKAASKLALNKQRYWK